MEHPPEVHAELARLQAVAEAREAAAAAAEPEGRPYFEEVSTRARAAHAAACALVADPPAGGPPPPLPVPRVHCSELPLARFRREFCSRSAPVVITGLGPHLTEDGEKGAELAWLRKHGGTKKVAVSLDNAHVSSTLACKDTEILNLGEHLDRVLKLDHPNLEPTDPLFNARDGDGTYLYDCAMPLKLPSVLGSVRIPRYFAHDFLQRTRYAHAFTASWPSLFVAAPHTKSSLHVDQWSGNFWMAMVKGTKRWTLFHKDDVAFCAPDYSRGTLDPAFPRMHEMDEARARGAREKTKTREGESDVSGEGHPHNDVPFFGAFPFLPYARRWDVDLGPGEVLFVPGGFPHVVHNLDVTVSFAGNYVDESNLDLALRDMALLGAKYGDAMRASHAAIDEVWFDENDEVWVEERLTPAQLVVRYEDYRGGAAGFWGAEDWQGVESAEGKALTAA